MQINLGQYIKHTSDPYPSLILQKVEHGWKVVECSSTIFHGWIVGEVYPDDEPNLRVFKLFDYKPSNFNRLYEKLL